MVWRIERAVAAVILVFFFFAAKAAFADGVLPGLQAPNYPGGAPAVGTAPPAMAPPVYPLGPVPPPQPGPVPVTAPVAAAPAPVPAATPSGLAPAGTLSPPPSVQSWVPQPGPSSLLVTPQSAPVAPDINFALLQPPCRPRSDLYARVDYFTWKEFIDSYQVLEETGPLVSIGYLREGIHTRIRAELFVGDMNYEGETMAGVPLDSQTGYFGGRFDFDLLARRPTPGGFVEFFAGLGTRAWQRDLKAGWDAEENPVISYQEDWWTVYLYGGLGISRALSPTLELYGSARAGATVFTRQHVSLDDVYLQPRAGFHGAMEFGLRGKHLAMAVRMEMMAWAESSAVATWSDGEWWGIYQPQSEMSTIGLSLAYTY